LGISITHEIYGLTLVDLLNMTISDFEKWEQRIFEIWQARNSKQKPEIKEEQDEQ
jgi:hypothetical protein